VGKSSVAAIANNPNSELVGLYAWSDDKVGQDAGELAGIEPLGVKATNDVDELPALKPTWSITTRGGSTSTSWSASSRQA
jgi:hypothetical protein